MTSCPTCNKPVDPLRARAVGVRDGKIVAYCSAECAARAEGSKPNVQPAAAAAVARKATPASGTPKGGSIKDYDSGPVIEILHEPVSGVVTSARDPRESGAIEATKPERADKTPPPAPPKKDRTDKTPIPASKEPTTEIDPREFMETDDTGGEVDADAVDGDDDDNDASGGRRRPGPQTIRRRRDSHDAKLAHDWLDDEPADVRPGTNDEESVAARRSGGMLVTLFILVALGGGGYLVYKYVYLPRQAATAKPAASTVGGVVPGSVEQVPAPPPEPVALDSSMVAKQALERAQTVLRSYLESTVSPRVSRAAAQVLARSGEKAAVDRLVSALEKDKLEDSHKLEVAYALARSGDKRGSELLAAAANGAPRRDDKLAAGRLLAQLGDDRAIAPLSNFLELSQHRLGAATELARFNEARAIKVLEQIRGDEKSSPDEKKTATIALGMAGKADVTEDLRAMLDDPHFNLFAAQALATMHDDAARGVLVKQLEFRDLRVRAARSLRQLAPDLDTSDYLKTLVTALDDPTKQKDTEQIPTAEAILLLAGPATWSERM